MQESPIATQDMRILELNAEYLGVSLGILMENAGKEVARVVTSTVSEVGTKIAIVCGVGGNGGDGFVAARHLQEAGADVSVYLIGDPTRISAPHSSRNWAILQNLSIGTRPLRSETAIKKVKFCEYDIIIDALLGFGLTTKVREPARTAIKAINNSGSTVFSIDIPSGMNSDTGQIMGDAVTAVHTITMHAPKPGLLKNPEIVGSLHIAPIGIPNDAYHICGSGDLWLFNRPRRPDVHKGDFGRILIVGGSDVYTGAPALAGIASLRTGADLVSVIAPAIVAPAIRSYSPNLMVRSTGTEIFDESCIDQVLNAAAVNDVIGLGPGLGIAKLTEFFFKKLIKKLDSLGKPLVIDADGLKALATADYVFENGEVILTPHWGEMQVLLKKKCKATTDELERLRYAKETAEQYNAIVLLKGATDVIASPTGDYKFNRTGHPAMSVGGTGDVLTGISAALLARKHSAFHAASAAAFISGRAGEYAVMKTGGTIMATDVIESIPAAMK